MVVKKRKKLANVLRKMEKLASAYVNIGKLFTRFRRILDISIKYPLAINSFK